MVTNRIKFPNLVINGITEHPDGLVSIPLFEGKYFFNPDPVQISDLGILIDHPIIPICKLVFERVEVEYCDKYRDKEAEPN